MLPVMFAARKLDGEDPMVVYYLRIAYGVCQGFCVLAVLYTYMQANNAATKYPDRIIYVPPAPTVRVLLLPLFLLFCHPFFLLWWSFCLVCCRGVVLRVQQGQRSA